MRAFYTLFLIIILASSSLLLRAQTQEPSIHSERSINPKSISIYPNPALDYVEVNLDQLIANDVTLTLYNIIGNQIQVESETVDEHKIRIRVKDFAAGYYLIAIRDEKANFRGTYKFLKR